MKQNKSPIILPIMTKHGRLLSKYVTRDQSNDAWLVQQKKTLVDLNLSAAVLICKFYVFAICVAYVLIDAALQIKSVLEKW